jgi:hypothetical protein
MNHPLTPNLHEMSEEDLDAKIKDLLQKMNFAYRATPNIIPQMQNIMEDYREERERRDREKMEKVMKQAGEDAGKGKWDDIIDI